MKEKTPIVSSSFAIANSNSKIVTLKNFYNNIISEENLRAAWIQLKSNPGMMTSGASTETLNNLDSS